MVTAILMDGKTKENKEPADRVIYLRRRADWEYLREDFEDRKEEE